MTELILPFDIAHRVLSGTLISKDGTALTKRSKSNWWRKVCLPSETSISPQLAIVIKNVGYDFQSFCEDLKAEYPGVEKVVRLRHKDQFETKLVKGELNNRETRDKILERGKTNVNYISYDVDEYIG
ncbi:unnamed protein product [Didymodactylos carnosus]|uniref:Uncharacterized protein n=1 Tax=Didymodactylos carnosus TaxID=1234261 RepID=A0A814IZT4_9BILA|nr:unnamed protein product [Didymodactylos carnosus]CAF3801420.1 unnamed protein product [Didymodactylos carnosus]